MLDQLRDLFPGWLARPDHYHTWYEQMLCLIPLLPLLGFLINAFARKTISRGASGAVATLAAAMAFGVALLCYMACAIDSQVATVGKYAGMVQEHLQSRPFQPMHAFYGTWLDVGGFRANFGLYMDELSGLMTLVVTGVGTLIHLYSTGYMGHDKSYARYFAYLNLFLFAMLLLVLGDNLILTFVGWEGVGLCSYLLIGFWYTDGDKAAAGMKAFLFNRVGDLGFLLGIFTLIAVFGTVDYVAPPEAAQASSAVMRVPAPPAPKGMLDYAANIKRIDPNGNLTLGQVDASQKLDLSGTVGKAVFPSWSFKLAIGLACLLLFVGAMGKSAQLPLYAWLPDAMAGPTPVSALIHAATMVTAGVYMVARLHALFLFSPHVMMFVAFVGTATAIFAALIGLTQTDIKKVLAYSTVSQLGYMFLAAGAGAFSLAIFHVVTHAFFKALLFLGAGSVIHGMSDEQDMRKMGGLRKHMPVTFVTMLIGSLALAGFPFTAGWFSKDTILAVVLAKSHDDPSFGSWWMALYGLGLIAAFCTAFYTFRLVGMTFFGACRADEKTKAHIHESPAVMTIPLITLAAFALLAGWMWHAFFSAPHFLGMPTPLDNFNMNPPEIGVEATEAQEHWHHVHLVNLGWTSLAALGGIALALVVYVAKGFVPKGEGGNVFTTLSRNKFYLEAFYDKIVSNAFILFAELMHVADVLLIDTLLVRGVAVATRWTGAALRSLQSGLVNFYAGGVLVGALVILYLLLLS
ncbi:MAG: NADH-quinone oxidoreductase subunit L [Planctomycetes bacterium]|nr:NADH-quinone oxidoreductase subunit L [Planctomycetota bacterium]